MVDRTKSWDEMMKPTTQMALHWRALVSQAALLFEARWTQASLRRLDPDLAEALHDQVNLFGEACVTGTAQEIERHGEATIRGYGKAVEAMQNEHIEDDAYMLGTDMVTGTKVAIGTQKAAVQRVRQIHGNDVIWLTPDEVARMLAGIESFKMIGAVKRLFPGAEIIDRYPEEGNAEVGGSND
jgi:hypothetical protein